MAFSVIIARFVGRAGAHERAAANAEAPAKNKVGVFECGGKDEAVTRVGHQQTAVACVLGGKFGRIRSTDDAFPGIVTKDPGWQTNRAEQRFGGAGWYVDDEALDLALGNKLQRVRRRQESISRHHSLPRIENREHRGSKHRERLATHATDGIQHWAIPSIVRRGQGFRAWS